MTGDDHTAGTAGNGYKTATVPHRWIAHDSDWGFRPACRTCGEPLAHENHRLPAAVAS